MLAGEREQQTHPTTLNRTRPPGSPRPRLPEVSAAAVGTRRRWPARHRPGGRTRGSGVRACPGRRSRIAEQQTSLTSLNLPVTCLTCWRPDLHPPWKGGLSAGRGRGNPVGKLSRDGECARDEPLRIHMARSRNAVMHGPSPGYRATLHARVLTQFCALSAPHPTAVTCSSWNTRRRWPHSSPDSCENAGRSGRCRQNGSGGYGRRRPGGEGTDGA